VLMIVCCGAGEPHPGSIPRVGVVFFSVSVFSGLQIHTNIQHAPILGSVTLLLNHTLLRATLISQCVL